MYISGCEFLLQKIKPLYQHPNTYLGVGFEFGPQKVSDLAAHDLTGSMFMPIFIKFLNTISKGTTTNEMMS